MLLHASCARALLAAGLIAVLPVCGAWAETANSLTGSSHASTAQVAQHYAELPLSFEANRGQADASARFLARGNDYSLYLTGDAAVLAFCHALPGGGTRHGLTHSSDRLRRSPACNAVRMQIEGANSRAKPTGEMQLPGKINYFIGNDPARWRTGIPTYANVRYQDIYPGIDLVYYGNHRELEYDFVVAPGADAKLIRLQFDGAVHVRRAANGDLMLRMEGGGAVLRRPQIYQLVKGSHAPVTGEFTLAHGGAVQFRLGRYDHGKPLVIDPTLVYSTLLGGGNSGGGDAAYAIAVDASGEAYIAGSTGPNFPVTSGVFQPQDNDSETLIHDTLGNGFVTKLNAAGTALVYSTYLGGSGTTDCGGDSISAIAVDSSGDTYVTGSACSTDFPVTPGAFQTTNKAAANQVATAFVTELNPTGTALVYSTYLGGSGILDTAVVGCSAATNNSAEVSCGIAVDSAGEAYVAGSTESTNFPVTPEAFQTVLNGGSNAFVTKVNATGTALVYSTYLGGRGADAASGIAVDSAGNAYVTGKTSSTNFPVTSGAFQTTLHPSGSTYVFPDAFVTKLNPTGTSLVYSTYLGGSTGGEGDSAAAVAVDASGNAYIAGSATSTDFPVTAGAFQTTNNFGFLSSLTGTYAMYGPNAFLTKLNPAGSALVYSTYLGGSGGTVNFSDSLFMVAGDQATGVAVDSAGDGYVTGYTASSNFPVTQGAFQTVNNDQVLPYYGNSVGGYNAFVTELNPSGNELLYSTFLGGNGVGWAGWAGAGTEAGYGDQAVGLALDSTNNVYAAGNAVSVDFPVTSGAFQTALQWVNPGPGVQGNAFISKFDLSGAGAPLIGTTTVLTASATSATSGTNITFTATVTPASGNALPTGTVTFLDGTTTLATGTLNASGQANYSTTQLPVGADSITAVYGGDPNFNGSTSPAVTVTISAPPPPDFSLSISPGSGTETSSTSASTTVTVTPVNGFNAAVTFACSGLPSGVSCSFNPSTVTPAGAPANTTVTFSGTNSAMASPDSSGGRAPLIFAALGFGFWFFSRARKCRRIFGRLSMIAFAVALGIGATACGGSVSSGPSRQTSTVTITATSGSLSQTTAFTLTSSN